jgi:hypothetical protein
MRSLSKLEGPSQEHFAAPAHFQLWHEVRMQCDRADVRYQGCCGCKARTLGDPDPQLLTHNGSRAPEFAVMHNSSA